MRVLFFVGVVIVAGALPWWALLFVAGAYAFRYRAWELVFLGVFLDAFFGHTAPFLPVPLWYTLAAALLVGGLQIVKPRLAFVQHD